MGYIPAFDGMRAIAVMLVVGFHIGVPSLGFGYLGVDIFFVLSGFLITSLLLKEHAQSGTLRIGRFYRRRFARLMPALLCMLAFYLLVAPFAWPDYPNHHRDALIAAAYLGDVLPTFWQWKTPLQHTWSLAVEEHYYLLWPLLLLLVVRSRPSKLPQILLAAYIAGTLWRMYWVASGQPWEYIYSRLDMRLSGLILGSWLGACVHRDPQMPAPSLKWAAPMMIVGAFGIASSTWGDARSLHIGIPTAELLTVLMILVVRHAGVSSLHGILGNRQMVYLGKISYGIYLYHYPLMSVLGLYFNDWPTMLVVGLPATIALASLSYHTIERRAARPTAASAIPA